MRIAILHSRYSDRVPSGENVVVDAEAAALRRAGQEIAVFQTDPAQIRESALYPIRAAARATTGRGRSFAGELGDFRPDVVHVHNVFPDLGEKSVAALPFRLVVTAHNYRWGCAAGTFFRSGQNCTDCVSGRPYSGVRHGCHHGPLGSLPLAFAHRNGISENPIVTSADLILCPSAVHRRKLIEHGLPQEKSTVSPHFLPAGLEDIPTTLQRTDGYLFVGRLEEAKGVRQLVRYWPRDRGPLSVMGDGPLRAELENMSRGKPIHFLGNRPRHEVMEHLAASRALIFASRWWEPFGLVAIEALSVGTPIVTWGQHAVSDLVEGHFAGAVIPSVKRLTSGLDIIEAATPEAWSANLQATFRNRYSETAWLQRRLTEYGDNSR